MQVRNKLFIINFNLESKKGADFELSLITIDTEHLGIPDTKYSSFITMMEIVSNFM